MTSRRAASGAALPNEELPQRCIRSGPRLTPVILSQCLAAVGLLLRSKRPAVNERRPDSLTLGREIFSVISSLSSLTIARLSNRSQRRPNGTRSRWTVQPSGILTDDDSFSQKAKSLVCCPSSHSVSSTPILFPKQSTHRMSGASLLLCLQSKILALAKSGAASRKLAKILLSRSHFDCSLIARRLAPVEEVGGEDEVANAGGLSRLGVD